MKGLVKRLQGELRMMSLALPFALAVTGIGGMAGIFTMFFKKFLIKKKAFWTTLMKME